MLSKIELELLVKMLKLVANEFSNHGCNDFYIKDKPGVAEFMAAMDKFNYGDVSPQKPRNGEYCTMDYSVMYYLATRCQDELKSHD